MNEPSSAGPKAFLKVIEGEDMGKGWQLDPRQVYIVGRSHNANLRLYDVATSGMHSRIECENDVWSVADLDSTHGTRLNEQRILTKKPMFDRDTVGVGNTTIEFREYEEMFPADFEESERGITRPE